MLKTLIPLVALLGCSVACFGQTPTVSNITFDGLSHSTVRYTFRASAQFYWIRTRYAVAPASCTDGVTGSVQGSAYSNFNAYSIHSGDGNRIVLGGLTASTTYQVCPEISTDSVHWSTGVGAALTTLAMPSMHPALPQAPATFNTNYPDTTTYNQMTVAVDCSDLMSKITSALSVQQSQGSVISIPAGTVCTGPYNISQRASDVTAFTASAVNTSSNTITQAAHGFQEGEGIIFGFNYGCLPGSLTNLNGGDCHKNGPIIAGQIYYAHVVDSNTFQVYSGASMSAGGVLCTLADAGNGTMLFVHWPRPLKWIIIRTGTQDQAFVPEHVRLTPMWQPKLAVIQAPASLMAGAVTANTLVSVGDFDGNDTSMIANLRFVGLEFTYSDNTAAYTTEDPLPWYTLFATVATDQNVILDRCYIHGLGTPHRVYNAIRWDGLNVGIVDSYFDNLEYFHAMYSGLGLTKVN